MVDRLGEDTSIYSLKANSWRRPNHQQGPKYCLDRPTVKLAHFREADKV